jgi:hypothetical protein
VPVRRALAGVRVEREPQYLAVAELVPVVVIIEPGDRVGERIVQRVVRRLQVLRLSLQRLELRPEEVQPAVDQVVYEVVYVLEFAVQRRGVDVGEPVVAFEAVDDLGPQASRYL